MKIKFSRPIFTCDLEDWNDALHIFPNGHSSDKAWWWLLFKIQDYEIKCVFYVLDYFKDKYPDFVKCIEAGGHIIKSHGKWHYWWENADRRPYQWLGLTGGFWFRLLPFWFIKWQVKKQGLFYCHPHDFDEDHPKLKNPFLNWKRHVGLKTSKEKLEHLLKEIQFASP